MSIPRCSACHTWIRSSHWSLVSLCWSMTLGFKRRDAGRAVTSRAVACEPRGPFLRAFTPTVLVNETITRGFCFYFLVFFLEHKPEDLAFQRTQSHCKLFYSILNDFSSKRGHILSPVRKGRLARGQVTVDQAELSRSEGGLAIRHKRKGHGDPAVSQLIIRGTGWLRAKEHLGKSQPPSLSDLDSAPSFLLPGRQRLTSGGSVAQS